MKKRKILKRILITFLIVIAVLVTGAYCVFNFYIKPKYSKQIMDAVSEIMNDEEFMAQINETLADEQVQNDINNALADEQLAADIESAVSGESGAESAGENAAGESVVQPSVGTEQSGSGQSVDTKKENDTVSTEGKTPMEIAKENVSPKDFATGMKIASKIDVGYLSGLSKGGFTAEEKQQAKEHLKSRLSGSEISQLSSLISKYSYLLK